MLRINILKKCKTCRGREGRGQGGRRQGPRPGSRGSERRQGRGRGRRQEGVEAGPVLPAGGGGLLQQPAPEGRARRQRRQGVPRARQHHPARHPHSEPRHLLGQHRGPWKREAADEGGRGDAPEVPAVLHGPAGPLEGRPPLRAPRDGEDAPGQGLLSLLIMIYIYIYTHIFCTTYVYIYIYIYGEREREI